MNLCVFIKIILYVVIILLFIIYFQYLQRCAQPWGRVGICTPCFKTGGAYAPPVHMPHPEIRNSMFLPQLKKAVRGRGADGADSKTPPVTSLLLIFSRPPKIHCYNPYLFLTKLNLSYQICVRFIFIYQKNLKGMFKTGFKYKITF